jgi:hypothetical protein
MAERPELTVDEHPAVRVMRARGTGEADPFAVPFALNGGLTAGRFTPDTPTLGSALTTWQFELPLGPGLSAGLPLQWPRVTFTIDPTGNRPRAYTVSRRPIA